MREGQHGQGGLATCHLPPTSCLFACARFRPFIPSASHNAHNKTRKRDIGFANNTTRRVSTACASEDTGRRGARRRRGPSEKETEETKERREPGGKRMGGRRPDPRPGSATQEAEWGRREAQEGSRDHGASEAPSRSAAAPCLRAAMMAATPRCGTRVRMLKLAPSGTATRLRCRRACQGGSPLNG